MRRKHYAIGAVILAIGAAAAVHNTGFGVVAYLPNGMTAPFSAPPAIKRPAAETKAAVIPAQPKAPAQVAGVPANAPVDPAETTVASHTAPSDTPFAWQGSAGNRQSWKGTGGHSAASSDGPSTPTAGFSGGTGGGLGGGDTPSLPSSSEQQPAPPSGTPKAPTLTESDPGQDGGDTSKTQPPSDGGGQGFLNGPAEFASYQAPDGDELIAVTVDEPIAVTVDEPSALAILLVGALGLLAARRATKRGGA